MTNPDPAEVLEKLFEIIRQEAAKSPVLTRRLLELAGVTVTFTGTDAVKVADPISMAAHSDYVTFRECFYTLTDKQLKTMLSEYKLATEEQVAAIKSKAKKDGFIELLWKGSQRRLEERRVK